jgi:hypothetical protein
MPKLGCPCGFIHDLSPIPDHGWLTIQDENYEALIEAEAGRVADPSTSAADLADEKFRTMVGVLYECPKCGRLLWEKPEAEKFRCYLPETEG